MNLGEGPKHVSQLIETLDLPQATVSRHLKVLRERSLVTTQRDGSFIYYELANPDVLKALDIMRSIMANILEQQRSLAEAIL